MTLEERILKFVSSLKENDSSLYEYLPEECEAKEYPVVFLWNVYDIQEENLVEIQVCSSVHTKSILLIFNFNFFLDRTTH
jgi:hypothetical protein